MARDLAEHFRTLDAIRHADRQQLERVRGLGPQMSIAIRDFFTDERNQRAIDVLLEAGVQVVAPKVSKALLLAGKTFVFTGTLQRFSGHEASQQVESLGAQATTSISGQTDYVVVGMDPGQKRDEAKAKGVQILTEEQFVSLMREAGAEV